MQRKTNSPQRATDTAGPRFDSAEASGAKYRTNPQVEADLAEWRERNPREVEYFRSLPRERLENTLFLRLMRAERQREAAREAITARFMADEPMLKAYMVRAQKVASKMNLNPGDEAQVKAAAVDLFFQDRRTNAIHARKRQQEGASGQQPSSSSRIGA